MLKDENFVSDTVTLSSAKYKEDVNEIETRHQNEIKQIFEEIEKYHSMLNSKFAALIVSRGIDLSKEAEYWKQIEEKYLGKDKVKRRGNERIR